MVICWCVTRAKCAKCVTRASHAADSGAATQLPVAPPLAARQLPVMPELVMTGGQLQMQCEADVLRAMNKVMLWLEAPAEAYRQLYQRYQQWLPVDGGNDGDGGMSAFQRAYVFLQDAVSSGEREYIVSVLGQEWGVSV